MKKHAIYFIPDISGFTDFVTNTEIEHSKHIIAELLEILLDNNIIHLELAEIEGDALFMYTRKLPEFKKLAAQSKLMLRKFKAHLSLYESRRICNCGACISAPNLKLKFIVHYGEIAFMRVKKIIKPYGKDVIKVHRLLKNSLQIDQYLLVTSNTVDFYEVDMQRDYPSFKKGRDRYDFGSFTYFFDDYSGINTEKKGLHMRIPSKPAGEPKLLLNEYTNLDILNTYKIISSFEHRTKWYKLIDDLIYDEFRVNRGGTVHNCVSGSEVYKVETLSTVAMDDAYIYAERTQDIENLSDFSFYITLFKDSNDRTQLKLEVFFEYETEDTQVQSRIKMKLFSVWRESMARLVALLDTIGIQQIKSIRAT
ncbi:DUF2652 domain-containing protein [Maribacter sp. 2304DJ31-5]|uniref:DUF2652 domain-containing protein n=1 Tax=Maribacter sp. 2304DJ31-5 TaxID=3386273 RepID=UPI0039BD80DD